MNRQIKTIEERKAYIDNVIKRANFDVKFNAVYITMLKDYQKNKINDEEFEEIQMEIKELLE